MQMKNIGSAIAWGVGRSVSPQFSCEIDVALRAGERCIVGQRLEDYLLSGFTPVARWQSWWAGGVGTWAEGTLHGVMGFESGESGDDLLATR